MYTYRNKYNNFLNIQINKCRHLKEKNLNKIRIELDKLDNSFIKLIKKRTILVKKVLKLKEKKIKLLTKKE